MPLGSFTCTYSLKVNTISVLCTGTPVAPGRGLSPMITGGMVSFFPPEGGVVVLAHDGENIMDPMTKATGSTGKYLDNIFLIFIVLYFGAHDILDAIHAFKLGYQLVEGLLVRHEQVDGTAEYSFFGSELEILDIHVHRKGYVTCDFI